MHHTVLGMMHNWLEGILQNHTRAKWGIGGFTSKGTQTQKNRTTSSVDDEMEVTTEDAYEETNDALTDSGILPMVENVDRMDVDGQDNQERYKILTEYSTDISLIFAL